MHTRFLRNSAVMLMTAFSTLALLNVSASWAQSEYPHHVWYDDNQVSCEQIFADHPNLLPRSPRTGYEIVTLPGPSNPDSGYQGEESVTVPIGGGYMKTFSVMVDIGHADGYYRWTDTSSGPDQLADTPGVEVAKIRGTGKGGTDVYIGVNMTEGELSLSKGGSVTGLEWCYVTGPCGAATPEANLATCQAFNSGFDDLVDADGNPVVYPDGTPKPHVNWYNGRRFSHFGEAVPPLNMCGCEGLEMRWCDPSLTPGTEGSCGSGNDSLSGVSVIPEIISGANSEVLSSSSSGNVFGADEFGGF